MRTLSRFLSLGLCTLALAHAGAGNGIGSIKVGLGKNPPGKIVALATTDSSGTVRFRITEPGTYTIEIQNPLGTGSAPEGAKAMTVKLQGQTSKAVKTEGLPTRKLPAAEEIPRLATGRIVQDASPARNRLEHPGIGFDEFGANHVETITVTEPTDLMLRLTDETRTAEDPQIYGLPPYLSFVAIEGGPSPLPFVMESGFLPSAVSLEWLPANAKDPLQVVLTDVGVPQLRTQKRTSVAPNTRGLPVGLHGGNIVFRIEGVEVDQTVPVYVRILPRTTTLPPVADRKTLYYANNSTTNSVTVFNSNAVAQTYTVRNQAAADNATVLISPQEFTLAPGESRRVAVQFLGNPTEEQKQVNIYNERSEFYSLNLLKPRNPCTPNKLYPVIGTLGLNASSELGANATVEVYNSCGGQSAGLLVKASNETTGKSTLLKTIGVGNYGIAMEGGTYKLEAFNLLTDGTESTGESRIAAIRQLELPALAEDDEPVILEEIVNAVTGEPTALAPGMTALYRGHIPIRCCQISFGDKVATDIQRTKEGLLFDIPVDIEPQGKAVKVEGVPVPNNPKPKPQALVISIAPSSPTVETTVDGTALLLKHANLEDPGDDYTTNGNAPPKAGDLVSFAVAGLGLAAVEDIQILVNGVPAPALRKNPCIYKACILRPPIRPTPTNALLFTMPEVAASGDATEGPMTIQVIAMGATSNLVSTSNVTFAPVPPQFSVSTSPVNGLTLRINGADVTGSAMNNLKADASGNATFDVVPEKQLIYTSQRWRWDFENWTFFGPGVGGSTTTRQLTRNMKGVSEAVAAFRMMVKVTVKGGTLTPASPDDFYNLTNSSRPTLVPNCPAGQVFDTLKRTWFGTEDVAYSAVSSSPAFPSNPTNVPLELEVNCKAGTTTGGTVQVTLNTNLGPFASQVQAPLPSLQVTQTGTGGSSGAGWPTFTQPVNPGAILLSVSPTQILHTSGNLRFDFTNWTGTGITGAGTQATNQQATMPNAATTYTANFDLFNKVEGTVTGTCTVTPAIGSFIKNGSNVTFTVTPASALVSAVYAPGPGAVNTTLTNNQTFQFVGGSLTVNCGGGPSINVTVITNPPSVQAEVGIANAKTAGLHQASLPASSAQTLTAQDPFLNTDGTYYRFNNWTPSGPGVALPATGNIIYTANYVVAGYQVDASGCGITVGPAARQISANPLVFSTGGTLTLGATPPSGQTFQNFTVSPLVGGGATNTYNTNPANIPFTGPVRIVASCGAAATVPVTLNTNLGPFATAVQGTPALQVSQTGGTPGSGWPTLTQPVNPGAVLLSVSPTQILNTAGNIRFDFKNWTGNGVAGAGTQASNQSATMPNAATTYTANFDLLNKLEGTVTGTCTVSPAIGTFILNGSNVTFNVTPASALVSAVYAPGPGAVNTPLTNGQTFQFVGGSLTVNCGGGAPVNVTVITAPPSVQAEVGIGTGKTAGIHQASLPASSAQTLTAQDPFLGTDGNYYRFNNWTPAGPGVTLPATGNVTYTANYTLVGYRVDASGCGITVSPTSRQISANPLIFGGGGPLFISANPPAGQTFQSFVVTPLSGGAATTYNNNSINIPFDGPIRIVANCGAPSNIDITLVSNPASGPSQLGITHGSIGVPGAAGPRVLSIPSGASTPLILSADGQFVAAGTGYRFSNFTPGGFSANPATVTPKPTASTTYTANYTAACYVLTLEPTPAAGGTATINPASGNVAGFPANCYAPGTNVTLTSQPNTGYGHNSFGGPDIVNTNAVTTTFAMNGPKNVKIFFDTVNNVTLTVATVPPGIDARIGATGPFAPAPINRSVPANTPQPVAVPSPALLSGSAYTFQSWSNGVTTTSTQAQVQAANLTMTATFTLTCHVLSFSSNPAAGGTVTASTTGIVGGGFPANCYAPGTTVTLTANPASGQALSGWTGATPGSGNTATVVMSQPRTVTANFGAPTTVAITVTSNPVGLRVRVDGTEITTPQVFNWTTGSTHALTVTSPQPGATGVRSVWQTWSQGGAQTQTVTTPNAATTYTANFKTQYLVTTGTNPAFTGDLKVTTSPAPSDNYFDAGSTVSFTASGTGNGAYSFGAWQGGITSSANPASLTISAPVTVTAVFDRALGVGGSINNRFPQGTNGYLHRLTVQPNVAVTNMIVTGVQVAVVTGTGAVSNTTSLPINVGTVAANAQSTSMDITATIPTTVTMWTLTLSGTAVNPSGRTQNWTTTWTVQR